MLAATLLAGIVPGKTEKLGNLAEHWGSPEVGIGLEDIYGLKQSQEQVKTRSGGGFCKGLGSRKTSDFGDQDRSEI